MIYKGKLSTLCTYGGLLSATKINGKNEESLTLCRNHSDTTSQSPRHYSENSWMLILMYWYPPISTITEALLSLSTMKCKSFYICPCVTMNSGIPNICTNPIQGLLGNHTEHSTLFADEIPLSCVVVQLRAHFRNLAVDPREVLWFCNFGVKFKHPSAGGTSFSFTVRASANKSAPTM